MKINLHQQEHQKQKRQQNRLTEKILSLLICLESVQLCSPTVPHCGDNDLICFSFKWNLIYSYWY